MAFIRSANVSNTSNLLLPYLAAGQAQKHVTVNESLRRLDALVQLAVVSASASVQPASPADGAAYILPPGKSGAAWSAMSDHALAYYRDGAWEQISPREGWLAFVKDADQLLHYSGAAWALFAPNKVIALSATDRILGRVSAGAGATEEVVFTDAAQQLCDDASFEEMCATLGVWRVLAASAVAASHTGATSETTLATVTIPANAMGPNGRVRITTVWSATNSANNKTLRHKFGGVNYFAQNMTTQQGWRHQNEIINRNATNAQVGNTSNAFGSLSGAPIASAVDTSAAVTVLITGQLANVADTLTLESYCVEILRRA
jgi:hypothetical protein